MRKALGWEDEPFVVPSDILDAWRLAGLRSVKDRKAWEARLAETENDLRMTFERRMRGELPGGLEPALLAYKQKLTDDLPAVATRKSSEMALEIINGVVPETLGGLGRPDRLQQHPHQPDQDHHAG